MRFAHIFFVGGLLLVAVTVQATIFGSVHGIIHDPQHRPVQGAMVMLKAKSSEWSKSATTDVNGNFEFNAVPVGEYSVIVANPGFVQGTEEVMVSSGTEPVVHLQLRVAVPDETVNVSAEAAVAPTDSVTPTTTSDYWLRPAVWSRREGHLAAEAIVQVSDGGRQMECQP